MRGLSPNWLLGTETLHLYIRSELELVLERFYKGEPIQQSELPEDETVEADVLSISVPRNMFTDDKLENLQKLIEGKQTILKHAFRAE